MVLVLQRNQTFSKALMPPSAYSIIALDILKFHGANNKGGVNTEASVIKTLSGLKRTSNATPNVTIKATLIA